MITNYRGRGEHSVKELENMVEQMKERIIELSGNGKLPAFESLDGKRDELAEWQENYVWRISSHKEIDHADSFKSGFNAGVIERDKQWQNKVSKLVEALSWYASHNIKVTKTECGTGEMHPLAESALAEFYGEGK